MKHHPAHWGLHHHLQVCASSAATPAQRCTASVLTASPFCDHFFLRGRLKAGWEIYELNHSLSEFFSCCHKITFLLCTKNGKITRNDQSVSSATAAMPDVITDPAWDTEGGSRSTQGQPHCITKGICHELCPCPKQLQFSLWLKWSPSSQGTNADCSALLWGCRMVTWGPAWAKEHKAAPSLCHYLLAQTHIHTLQGHPRLHCSRIPNASSTGWLGDWSSTLSSVNMYCCHEFRASQLKH